MVSALCSSIDAVEWRKAGKRENQGPLKRKKWLCPQTVPKAKSKHKDKKNERYEDK